MSKPLVKWALILAGALTLLAVLALAVPVPLWRTGEMPQPGLQYSPSARDTVKSTRVWIDADAACGTGKRRDPDDCLAVLSLAIATHIDIAGISTLRRSALKTVAASTPRPHCGRPCSTAPSTSWHWGRSPRQVSMTGRDLDHVARAGPAGRWVAERGRAWLEFWRSEAGLDGFYPFDLMAAAYVRDPTNFGCARVTAWVGDDAMLPWFGGGPALLVAQQADLPASAPAPAQALYCDVVRIGVDELFL